jgi:HEAT repeat protein
MASAFKTLQKLGPAAFVLKAILAAVVVDVLLLGFILLRRTYRRRYFAKRDARLLELREKWDALVSGEIPFGTWRKKGSDCRLVETLVLDALEIANPQESARLLKFLRASGLIEKIIFEARNHRGWRKHRALVALGRTRAPEGICALSEGLRDRGMETRLAALRGLGRMACPEAAEEILGWLGEVGLTVPELPLQSALIQCTAERPQLLLAHVQRAMGPLREVLGRVLGEVATPSLGTTLLQFVDDDLDELRAAAARAMSHAETALAIDALGELGQDPVWFVRLRAIVSLGKTEDPHAIPLLLRGVTDSNRLVRLRAAEGLVHFRKEMTAIFQKVVATGDRYGLYGYLAALENAGLQANLESQLTSTSAVSESERALLLEVLRSGELPVGASAPREMASAAAAARI